MHTKVAIIGAGLSGLHTAFECQKHGLDYCLIEARARLGGRVLSNQVGQVDNGANQPAFDLGPSWFWPGQQRMLSLIEELALTRQIIAQNAQGEGIYEDNQGNIQRGVDGISMAGANRLTGGISQLVHALAERLDSQRIFVNSSVEAIHKADNTLGVQLNNGQDTIEMTCNDIVLAMPPRVALATIEFNPAFSDKRTQQLNNIATWMAGHAKLVCVYEHNFWQPQGCSGDVISQQGPLQEIHDASSEDGSLNALFGFVGIPPIHRVNRADEIKKLALAQLVRLFGQQAQQPIGMYLQDWAAEKFTATQYDQQIQRFHAMNNIAHVQEPEWDNHLIWSGTESADYSMHNNGFLEGALEASMHCVSLLSKQS